MSETTLALRGGRIVDPAAGRDEVADLLIAGGTIVSGLPGKADREVDAAGLVVCPGFVEPHAVAPAGGVGRRWARQALAGGFTTVAAVGTARRARGFDGDCPALLPIAPLTVPGTRRLAEMADAAAAGAVAFSDFPEPHADAELLRRGLLYARMLDRPVFDLPRDAVLGEGGVAAGGAVAEELGLFAVPAVAESVAVARGIALARETRGRLHFAAASCGSTPGAVAAEAAALRRSGRHDLTVAVSAAHLLCTAEALRGFDPAGRVDPPFRDEGDRRALVGAATRPADAGPVVAALTSGHRPDPGLLDPVDLLAAPPGYEGFETALAAALTAAGADRLPRVIELLTTGPAGVLGVPAPSLEPGSPADAAVLDPSAKWRCEPGELAVPVARTPLAGTPLTGRVTHTVLGGRVAFERGTFPGDGPAAG